MERFIQYLIPEEIYMLKEDQNPDFFTKEVSHTDTKDPSKKLLNKTILLVSQEKEVNHTPQIQDLLVNIVHAVHLTLEEIILIPLHDPGPNMDPLAGYQMKDCRVIGFLESVPAECHSVFNLQKYTLKDTGEYISLLADPLEVINRERSKKVILWKKLKELYELK